MEVRRRLAAFQAADIRAFALAQPPRICLRDESCWTFASRVADHAIDDG